ncbi:MAG: hypothetical protein DRP47_12230 [Candidatus Zixiibacteriota bacterium]|nr:MAG: hypothetical protein DRP47_12230 [candidate division Zixibacteria bacterium]
MARKRKSKQKMMQFDRMRSGGQPDLDKNTLKMKNASQAPKSGDYPKYVRVLADYQRPILKSLFFKLSRNATRFLRFCCFF